MGGLELDPYIEPVDWAGAVHRMCGLRCIKPLTGDCARRLQTAAISMFGVRVRDLRTDSESDNDVARVENLRELSSTGLMSCAEGRIKVARFCLSLNAEERNHQRKGHDQSRAARTSHGCCPPASRPTVYLWRERFEQAGVLGLLKDAPRPGRRKALPPDKIQAIVDATLHTTPPKATHWSVRTMAKAHGVSHAIVHRIGPRMDCSPIASRPSNGVAIPTSFRSCATSSACISIHRTKRWSFAWTRSPTCKPSIAPNRCCRCGTADAR
jgi:transposase